MWARGLTAAVGIWLMAAPSIIGSTGPARTAALVTGPLLVAVALVAISEATRPVRWAGAGLGGFLVIAPLLWQHPAAAAITSVAAGLVSVGTALVRGPLHARIGGGWSALRGHQ